MAQRKNVHAAALGKMGGKARWKGVSSEERSAIARRAVQARWGRAKAKKRVGRGG